MKQGIGVFVGTILILVSTGFVLINSAFGLTLLLRYSISQPVSSINVESVKGSLFSTVKLNNVAILMPGTDIQIKLLELEISLPAVFARRLNIIKLHAEQLVINLKTQKISTAIQNHTSNKRFFNSAILSSARAEDVRIFFENKLPPVVYPIIEAENIRVDERLYLDKINASGFHHRLVISGELGLSQDAIVNIRTQWSAIKPTEGNPIFDSFNGTIAGTFLKLRFLQQSTASMGIRVEGYIYNILTGPKWEIGINQNQVKISSPQRYWPDVTISGEFKSMGDVNAFSLLGKASIGLDNASIWQSHLQSEYRDNKFTYDLKNVPKSGSDNNAHLTISGVLVQTQDWLSWRTGKIAASWHNLAIPNATQPQLTSSQGEFNLDLDKKYLLFQSNDIETIGIRFANINLTSKTDSTSNLVGSYSAGRGTAHIKADINFANDLPQINSAQFTGSLLPLIRTPDAHIIASPDIYLRKRDIGGFNSYGTIAISTANIRLPNFYSSVSNYLQPILKINNDASQDPLTIKLGDQVWLHGYGLNARVTGDLQISVNKQNEWTAQGELLVLNGQFTVNSEKYKISSGKMLFRKSVLMDPLLSLIGSSESNIGVNVAIEGSMQSPTVLHQSTRTSIHPSSIAVNS